MSKERALSLPLTQQVGLWPYPSMSVEVVQQGLAGTGTTPTVLVVQTRGIHPTILCITVSPARPLRAIIEDNTFFLKTNKATTKHIRRKRINVPDFLASDGHEEDLITSNVAFKEMKFFLSCANFLISEGHDEDLISREAVKEMNLNLPFPARMKLEKSNKDWPKII